jgi:hypothetical protein
VRIERERERERKSEACESIYYYKTSFSGSDEEWEMFFVNHDFISEDAG